MKKHKTNRKTKKQIDRAVEDIVKDTRPHVCEIKPLSLSEKICNWLTGLKRGVIG